MSFRKGNACLGNWGAGKVSFSFLPLKIRGYGNLETSSVVGTGFPLYDLRGTENVPDKMRETGVLRAFTEDKLCDFGEMLSPPGLGLNACSDTVLLPGHKRK